MISQRMIVSAPGQQTGTWVAAGAINDAGTATASVTADASGRVTARHTLTSSAGTLTLDSDTRLRPFPVPTPPRQTVEGTWKLVDATEAYAGLRARGRLFATIDRTTSPTGITIVRDGSAE
jgi:hypothetical protein